MICVLPLLLLASLVHVEGQGQGGAPTDAPTPRYSTKTGYDSSFEPGTKEIANRLRDWRAIARDVAEISAVAQCQPAGVYVVYRHGARYPGGSDIAEYNAFLTQLKKTGVSNDYAYLTNITDNLYALPLQGQLHPAGLAEMQNLGSRIKTRLPQLISTNPLNEFRFQSTYKRRTTESAIGFINGLLGIEYQCNITRKAPTKDTVSCRYPSAGKVSATSVDHEERERDRLLLFYQNCEKYARTVDNDPRAIIEQTKFARGPEMAAVRKAVSRRLTPPGSATPKNISIDQIELIHHMCGYETTYYGGTYTPWCYLLSDDEKRVVEYYLDLKYYWTEGYGYDINSKIACPLIDDIVDYLRDVASGAPDTPKGYFKFAHHATIQPLLTSLGLYKDSAKLMANNYNVSIDRDWSTGRIAPTGGNVAFSFLRCPSGQHRVLMLHNELPIKVGPCKEFFCPFNTAVSHLTASSGGCQFDETCRMGRRNPGNGADSTAAVYWLVATLGILTARLNLFA
ncbi:multiple inositol polyphosphate phosphatase 1-like [Diadema antillarum]|uniref:multiple inositol polyphosphate phosphatase 1-like n=1 Tax=Diadema antillarum TaxID=105358 RepID=UPI003A863327